MPRVCDTASAKYKLTVNEKMTVAQSQRRLFPKGDSRFSFTHNPLISNYNSKVNATKCKINLSICKVYFTLLSIYKIPSIMKSTLLLPHRFKIVGWCLLIPALLVWIVMQVTNNAPRMEITVFSLFGDSVSAGISRPGLMVDDVFQELIGVLAIIGGLLVGFSREKIEDEFIARLRLTSLQWAVLMNYVFLLLAIIFIYGLNFIIVMFYNMITVLLFFIARFNWILYRNSKQASHEK